MPASRTAKSPACDDGKRSATKSSNVPVKPGLAGPRRPGRDGPGDRRVEQPHLGEIGPQPLDLDEHRAGLAVEGSTLDRDLDVGPLALAQVADGVVAVLRRREQDPVVLRPAVVFGVVDVGVEPVLVDAEVEHAEPHLLRRAVGRGDIAPAGGRRRLRLGEPRLAGEAVRVIELQPERGRERRRVVRRDEVRGDAASRQERAEVEGGALNHAAATAGPLDLGHLLAAALGRLGQRLGLQHAGVERRRAIGERLAVGVERVVRRAVDARPRPGREREPAGPGVGRRLGQEAVAGRLGAIPQQVTEPRHLPLVRVALDEVLLQAVGREEQQLVVAVRALPGGRSRRRDRLGARRGGQSGHRQDSRQHGRPLATTAAASRGR